MFTCLFQVTKSICDVLTRVANLYVMSLVHGGKSLCDVLSKLAKLYVISIPG